MSGRHDLPNAMVNEPETDQLHPHTPNPCVYY